jgi:ribosomal protein S18 acetylase RimI-like enzyme
LRFQVGCDPEEMREYWSRNGYDGNLDYLYSVVIKDPAQLIVWKEGNKIVGHSVWHESNVEEHRKGDAREEEDKEALNKLLGKKREFVELHEIWLIEEYRGRGYGNQFFDFFESYMTRRGYLDLVFYAHHPAAIAICRKHGYKEGGYLEELKEYVFYHSLKSS